MSDLGSHESFLCQIWGVTNLKWNCAASVAATDHHSLGMALNVNKRDRTSIVVSFNKKQTRRTAERRCASYLRNFITLYFGAVLCFTKKTRGNSCDLASSFCPSRYCHDTSNNFCPSTSSLICFGISMRDCATIHQVRLLVRRLPHLELVFTDNGAGAEKYCIRFLSKGPRSL